MDYRVGDVRARLAEIPDGTVSLVASSPPFVALRSYLPADHPDKHLEIGSEPDPASFLDTLLGLTAEWGRVLAPWGSIAIELGDTYAGSGGAGGDYGPVGLRAGQNAFDGSMARTKSNRPGQYGTDTGPPRRDISSGWPRAKCLALVPQLYAASLAYGRNLLTGQPSPAGQWLVRNMIVWHRPNPAVGALGDKVRPSTSYIVVATRSPKRWFDLTAVRTASATDQSRADEGPQCYSPGGQSTRQTFRTSNTAGAPPLDCWFDEHDNDGHEVWKITTQPSPLPHYACVDEETQALTKRGWKYHDELTDGDQIAAYDADRSVITWQAATFHRYPYAGDLVAIDKRTTSQRLTPNHRVLLLDRKGTHSVVTAEELKPAHRVPLAAPFADNGTTRLGSSFAELLGWHIAEGSNRRPGAVTIYQSATVNLDKCERITSLLDAIGADYTISDRKRSSLSPHDSWVERAWHVRGHVATWLQTYAPGKRLTPEVVFGWSHAEIAALLDGLIGGDGHTRANGRRSFIQQDRDMIDMVQALCCRLGLRSTIGPTTNAWQLSIGERTATTLRGTDGKHEPIGREAYTGIVWCPAVPSTFWLARRNGRPFITGNTWPPKLAERLILMMCPLEVCATCGEPRRRIEGRTPAYAAARAAVGDFNQRDRDGSQGVSGSRSVISAAAGKDITCAETVTLGWTSCPCADYRPGVVLDPFCGTGTSLCVAELHGRDSIGVDLDARNRDLVPARMDECRRALFGTQPELPGQLGFDLEVTA